MSKKNTQAKKDYSDSDYEKIGRMVIAVGETGFKNKSTLYKMSFLKGVLSGIGGVIGATIVIALLLFLLSLLSDIPLIGTVAEKLQNSVENTTR